MAVIGKLDNNSSQGEKKAYNYLNRMTKDKSNFHCYYKQRIDDQWPDFLLFSQEIGVVVIIIENYESKTLIGVPSSDDWIIQVNGKERSINNPINKLYNILKVVDRRIKAIKTNLVQQVLVLSNISEKSKIGEKILTNKSLRVNLIFKDDISTFQSFLDIFNSGINQNFSLSSNHIDLIRGNLVPSTRLPAINQKPFSELLTIDDDLKLLDEEQERFARELGEGHRLIFGVAGSGKTILLAARVRHLATLHPNWHILVLCYNRLLRDYLVKLLNPSNFEALVEIDNFHRWSKDTIFAIGQTNKQDYQSALARCKNAAERNSFFKSVVPNLLMIALADSNYPTYDAIFIDEAQDWEKDWFFPVMKLLNPVTNSLLVASDGLQSIYNTKKFRWIDVGIEARGRVKKFSKTYRNPAVVGRIAFEFISSDPTLKHLLETEEEYLATDGFARNGGKVILHNFNSEIEERKLIIKNLHLFQQKNWTILILFFRNLKKANYNDPLISMMKQEHLDWSYLDKWRLNKPGIFIGTLHGTKGLEADAVIIPEINLLSQRGISRQLLYVGITRALHHVLLTANGENDWTRELLKIIENSSDSMKLENKLSINTTKKLEKSVPSIQNLDKSNTEEMKEDSPIIGGKFFSIKKDKRSADEELVFKMEYMINTVETEDVLNKARGIFEKIQNEFDLAQKDLDNTLALLKGAEYNDLGIINSKVEESQNYYTLIESKYKEAQNLLIEAETRHKKAERMSREAFKTSI